MRTELATCALVLAAACSADGLAPDRFADPLADDPVAFVEDQEYRRGILERDLLEFDNAYAQRRLANYAVPDEGWDLLPTRNPATMPVTPAVVAAVVAGEDPGFDPGLATSIEVERMPTSGEDWVALGERVFLEYPLRPEAVVGRAVEMDSLEDIGFLLVDGEYVGLRMFEEEGEVVFGTTCAACHGSVEPDGRVSGRMANRQFDVGRMRLLEILDEHGQIPPEFDSTKAEDLARLGPGRSDVLDDDEFNPYAFPDWGGLADLPYLHHTANWHNTGVATLAIRIETVFMTGDDESSRIPRTLAWAFAEYVRSLPPPPPTQAGEGPLVDRGAAVFSSAGCIECHRPPLFTSDRLVGVDEIGTDAAAGTSPIRRTGYYRVPSLRGVGSTSPYLHHGAFETLEEMFAPDRDEPGHRFGLQLDDEDREALIRFLRSI